MDTNRVGCLLAVLLCTSVFAIIEARTARREKRFIHHFRNAFKDVGNAFETMADGVADAAVTAVDTSGDAFKSVGYAVKEGAQTVGKGVKDAYAHVEVGAKVVVKDVGDGIIEAASHIEDGVNDAAKGIEDGVQVTVNEIERVSKDAIDIIEEIVNDGVDLGEDVVEEIADAGELAVSEVAAAAKDAFRFVERSLEKEYMDAKELFRSLVGDVDFDVAVAKLVHLIDSYGTRATCGSVCQLGAGALLGPASALSDTACKLMCKGALLLLEELAVLAIGGQAPAGGEPGEQPTLNTTELASTNATMTCTCL